MHTQSKAGAKLSRCAGLQEIACSLKIIQECITLTVFVVFAYFYLGEPVKWNYAVSFLSIVGAVFFAFWGSVSL